MKIFSLLLLLALVATAGLAVNNWNIFITPSALSFGFTTLQVPLGLVMLGIVIFITVLFFIYITYLQSSALLEAHHHSRELQVNRKLIDQAEATHFTELNSFLESELAKKTALREEMKSEILEKVDQFENNLYRVVKQSENSLFAYIGELEDRLGKNNNTDDNNNNP